MRPDPSPSQGTAPLVSGDDVSPETTAELLDLPWHLPLVDWPAATLAAMTRGLSRHVVRFARLGGDVVAVKETTAESARAEYGLLRSLARRGVRTVSPLAVVEGRTDPDGLRLASALVTKHLRFSLPYRAAFSRRLRRETLARLIDALALLLVELHLAGFYWGDVSLSNTLFRRDAGAFAAYLVDAETGELHPALSRGQRDHDLEIARVNIAGELMDLISGGLVESDVDPVATSQRIIDAYHRLWDELSRDGDPCRHRRRLLGLTGLDVQENQARRLLRDLEEHRAVHHPGLEPREATGRWLEEVFEPVARGIPAGLVGKLEPAEVMHQLLEHRWYLSENQSRPVPLPEALESYLQTVLPDRPDEDLVVSVD